MCVCMYINVNLLLSRKEEEEKNMENIVVYNLAWFKIVDRTLMQWNGKKLAYFYTKKKLTRKWPLVEDLQDTYPI